MKLIPSNAIDIGRRAEQEDDFGFSDPNDQGFVVHGGVLAVVIDGMGGVAHGGESARAGKAAFVRTYESKDSRESVPDALQRALVAANEAVIALGQQMGDPRSVGATLTAAVVHSRHGVDGAPTVTLLHWISVGDSALYLLRGGRLERLTVAHEVMDSVEGALVSSFLGYDHQLVQVDRSSHALTLAPGDRVLLCTDGLFKSVPEHEIGLELGRAHPSDAAQRLVDLAMSRNHASQDNVTALVVSCEPDSTHTVVQWTPPAPTRRSKWPVVVGLSLLIPLFGLGGFFGWQYRTDRIAANRRASEIVAAVQTEFAAGRCDQIPALLLQLKEAGTAEGARDAFGRGETCEQYNKLVDAANEKFDAARGTVPAAEQQNRLEEAIKLYTQALGQVSRGTTARERRDQAEKLLADLRRPEPERPQRNTTPQKAPTPPTTAAPGRKQSSDNAPPP